LRIKKPVPQIQDNDRELDYVLEALDTLHLKFYNCIKEKDMEGANVCKILPRIKQRVLEGVYLVFSGVFPLGRDPSNHELWISAAMFGAVCQSEINELTTHVIATKVGTVKVNKAIERKLWIVKPEWFNVINQGYLNRYHSGVVRKKKIISLMTLFFLILTKK
jgi:BRCT domain type II-containing protein